MFRCTRSKLSILLHHSGDHPTKIPTVFEKPDESVQRLCWACITRDTHSLATLLDLLLFPLAAIVLSLRAALAHSQI